ncbi:YbjN domain-containing protein [Dendronalium sp. ChiSLP03b]|uniref:YbjN domain-containing protein n=1 Tax=Dendronalium sp. ChiSLP03b TaxID=3075381 RepID=UPI002AD3DE9E|nr:YbjN domain-containing protein [Dendronalium sp. ChiSLP03b]MDZ8203796.1 YbjN domain-containing protein [Dendronalium sp. ChiSLP03b]
MQDQTHLEPQTPAFSMAIAPAILKHAIISPNHQDGKLVECCLICQLPLELYQTIEKNSLFNFKPELCNQSITFSPNTEITLKATLHPDCLPDFGEHATTSETALQYLQQLSKTQPDHSLLNLDNWFVLSAHQGELGYTTLWKTLNPSKLAAGNITEEELTQSLSQFLTNLTENQLTKAADHFIQELFSDFANPFKVDNTNPGDNPITNATIAFFTNDDWTFTKIQGKPILQMGYQGKNGQWLCYARANEAPQQFAFYSICPTIAPEERRLAIAEFIARANNGIVIGNFELNFSSGEILYKTSIDVESDRLTSALIKRLVYANVITIDQYLPGILAVIEGRLSPTEAIAFVESNADLESEGDR